jgi:hypothetical protein
MYGEKIGPPNFEMAVFARLLGVSAILCRTTLTFTTAI